MSVETVSVEAMRGAPDKPVLLSCLPSIASRYQDSNAQEQSLFGLTASREKITPFLISRTLLHQVVLPEKPRPQGRNDLAPGERLTRCK